MTEAMIFREIKQTDPSAPPVFQVGADENSLRLFTPRSTQLEPVAYLIAVTKNPDRLLPIALGAGPRRAEMIRRRIKNAVAAIREVAPAVAEELSRVEVRTWDGKPYIRLPWRAGAPAIR